MPAVHATQPVEPDGADELELADRLRREHTREQLLDLASAHAHGDNAADARMRRAVWRALAKRFETTDQYSDAVGMARRAVRFSWTDERALRRALLMLERLGDRAGAVHLYEEFARRLKAELETMIESCRQGRIDKCRVIEVLADHGRCRHPHH